MAEVPVRLKAALADRYTIEREIGAGGMATVYLAYDLRHDRKVALKVLKPELAAVVGAERFLAEIKTTANLQHPHILPLFESGQTDSFLFYVMPYVEGESLRDRLDREHQLPVDDAVQMAKNLAEALDYAHRRGVIHRDIKPANVLLLDGKPVISDFGIALAVGVAGGGRLTETGLSLGTPHYMSPEQATGDAHVGPATDIYALGCVLYEMLVGEPPYRGSTPQAVLGKIITEPAPLVTRHRRSVPVHVEATVNKALEKVPADRFRGAAELARALADPAFRHGETARTRAGAGAGSRTWLTAGLAGTTVIFAVLASWGWLGRPSATASPVTTRAELTALVPDALLAGGERLAISSDGSRIVAAGVDGSNSLSVRSADDIEWTRLPETEGGLDPKLSPDGQWVVFGADDAVWKVSISGGRRQLITQPGVNIEWLGNDTLVFARQRGLYRVAASGGEAQLIAQTDSLTFMRFSLLPGGAAVVFNTATDGDPTNARILLFEIETGELRELVRSGVSPTYVSTGHLIYAGDQQLMAVPFDLDSREVTGGPVTVIPELSVRPGGAAQYAISETGTLVYGGTSIRGVSSRRVLVRVAMEGTATPFPLRPGDYTDVQYSPDGKRLAIGDRSQIHLYDVLTGSMTPFTDAPGEQPAWSPGGDYLYFSSTRDTFDIFRRSSDGRGEIEALYAEPGEHLVTDVLPGDSVLVVQKDDDLVLARLTTGGAELQPFLAAPWRERWGRVSPIRDRITYASDESGTFEVYVRSFPDGGPPLKVSADGGTRPLWAPDGAAIYYLKGDSVMRASAAANGRFLPPVLLFERPNLVFGGLVGLNQKIWDIDPGASHFVTVEAPEDQESAWRQSSRILIVTNWFEELKRLAPK